MIRLIIMKYEHVVSNLLRNQIFEELLREAKDKQINNSPFFEIV